MWKGLRNGNERAGFRAGRPFRGWRSRRSCFSELSLEFANGALASRLLFRVFFGEFVQLSPKSGLPDEKGNDQDRRGQQHQPIHNDQEVEKGHGFLGHTAWLVLMVERAGAGILRYVQTASEVVTLGLLSSSSL